MKPLADKVLVFAYRGASAYAPENTVEAFELAHKMGADAVTLNVILTADGEVVTSDTPLINSVSNGQGLILDYTLEELKIFDFGYQFYKGQRKGIKIPTLEDTMPYTIPEGTQPGTTFTVRGKGIPYVNNNNRRGDLIFRVNVEIPRGLNEKQKDAMRAFAESCGESNYTKKSGFFKKRKN